MKGIKRLEKPARPRARTIAAAALVFLISCCWLVARDSQAAYYNLGAFWQNSCGAKVKLVQSAGPSYASGADAESLALGSNETSGNLLVAVVAAHTSSSGSMEYTLNSVVTDSAGNSWYPGSVWNNNDANPAVQFWYAPNIVGGANTITATLFPTDSYPGDTGFQLTVLEYSGLASTDVVDVAQAQLGSSLGATRNVSSGGMTTTTSCDLIVAAVSDEQDYSAVFGPGWRQEGAGTTNISLYVADNLPSAARTGTSANATATLSSADTKWVVGEMAFRAGSTTAPPQPTQLAFTSTQQSDNTWACSNAVTVTAENSSGVPTNTSTGLYVSLTGPGINYFMDPGCEYPLSPVTLDATAHAACGTTANDPECGGNSSATTLSYPLTVGTGSNRALAVFTELTCPAADQSDVGSVTYAGIPLVQMSTQLGGGSQTWMDLWALPPGTQPASGNNNVVVTFNSSTCTGADFSVHSGAFSAANVDQTSTFTSYSETSSAGTAASLNLPSSSANDLVVDFVCSGADGGGVLSTSQTLEWTDNVSADNGCDSSGGGIASGGTTALSWTLSNDSWNFAGASFKASSSLLIGAGTNNATYYFDSTSSSDNTITASGGGGNVVQTGINLSGSSPVTVTLSQPTKQGDLLVVGMADLDGVTSITDNAPGGGNTYVTAGARCSGGGAVAQIWYAKSVSPGATQVTVQWSGGSGGQVWVSEFSGMDPSNPLDSSAIGIANNQTGSTISTPAVTTTTPGELVYTIADLATHVTTLQPGPFIALPVQSGNDTAYALASSTGTYGATWSSANTGSQAYCASTVGFKPAVPVTSVSQSETITLAPFTWLGGTVGSNGCDGNWNTAACWGGVVPTSGNGGVAKFDGNCTSNCSPTITSNVSAGGIWMHSTYQGTIAPGTYNVAVSGSFEQDGGTFNAGSGTLSAGRFIANGGTFNANSSSITVSGAEFTDGTFNAGTSTVTFIDGYNYYTFNSTPTFNNVNIGDTGSGYMFFSGTFNVAGNLNFNAGYVVGGTAVLDGSSAQTVTETNAASDPGLDLNITTASSSGVSFDSALSISSGAVTIQSGVANMTASDLLEISGAFNVDSGATFNCNGGCGTGTACGQGADLLQCLSFSNSGTINP